MAARQPRQISGIFCLPIERHSWYQKEREYKHEILQLAGEGRNFTIENSTNQETSPIPGSCNISAFVIHPVG